MNIDITINNQLQTFTINENHMLNWAIYQSQPSTLQIASSFQIMPLLLLLNNTTLINADITSIFIAQNSQVITAQYALEIDYFYTLYLYLKEQGVLLFMESTALILFSLHTWLQMPNTTLLHSHILHLMYHYPHYVTQPHSLKNAHDYARKNIKTLQNKFDNYTTHNQHN